MIQKQIFRQSTISEKVGGWPPDPSSPFVGWPGFHCSFGAWGKVLDVNLKQIEPWTSRYERKQTDDTLKLSVD